MELIDADLDILSVRIYVYITAFLGAEIEAEQFMNAEMFCFMIDIRLRL